MAGGSNYDNWLLSSTEIFVGGVWTLVDELPRTLFGPAAVSVDNTIILTGKIVRLNPHGHEDLHKKI